MELQMFIGENLIDSVSLNFFQLNNPGYIHQMKLQLEEKNEDVIDLSIDEPVFFIESIPSRLNEVTTPLKN